MTAKRSTDGTDWAHEWLDAVANGSNTMSQRTLASVEARGGGLATVRAVARAKRVHLVLLKDDKGTQLVAASAHPFEVIC